MNAFEQRRRDREVPATAHGAWAFSTTRAERPGQTTRTTDDLSESEQRDLAAERPVLSTVGDLQRRMGLR